jgi:methyl-accepting chemotaxis protein
MPFRRIVAGTLEGEDRLEMRRGGVVMEVFRNLRTRSKIGVLVAIAGAALVGIALLGYRINGASVRAQEELYRERLLPTQWLLDNRLQGRAVMSDLLGLMLTVDEQENRRLKEDIERRVAIVDENLRGLDGLAHDAYEDEHIKTMKDRLAAFRTAYRKVLDLALENRNEEAYKLFVAEIGPAFEEYQKEVRDLSGYNLEKAKQSNEANRAAAARASLMLLLIPAGTLFLLILLGLSVAHMVAAPLDALREGVEHFAGGT